MTNNVDAYLASLKQALSGSDPATIQDALADAEEYLRNSLENALAAQPGMDEATALAPIIDEFGSPAEIAAAYRKIEARMPSTLAPVRAQPARSPLPAFFGVLVDPSAWGALLYLLLSLLTGILYFTWGVTGLSLSVGLIVLVIGLPFLGLFLLSARGIALVEGRIVEALLGVRMPRRPIFMDQTQGWWARFKALLFNGHTWMSILYMLLMLPLGVIYFSVFVTLISLALGLIAAPVVQLFLPFPMLTIYNTQYYLPLAWAPGLLLGGLLILILTMHLAKWIGRVHGSIAKAMLVGN